MSIVVKAVSGLALLACVALPTHGADEGQTPVIDARWMFRSSKTGTQSTARSPQDRRSSTSVSAMCGQVRTTEFPFGWWFRQT